MGIQGLLQFLEKATRPFHLSEFKGATVAIDAYCWLAKGSLEAINTDQIINYCMLYMQMLQYNEIRPILIFNGQDLPIIKARKEKTKKESLTSLGAVGFEQIKVSPELASVLIKKCHEFKIDCIVAPYEAAAQLAFFNLRGIAELVITENPDLILYGCSKICLKLDIQGSGLLLDSDLICDTIKMKPDCHIFDKFKHMCIFCGCDYIEPLEGMTLTMAHQFISLTQDTNPETFLDTIPKLLNMSSLQITQEFKINFMMVDAIYRHQIIFDPFVKKLEPLFDPHIAGTNPEYCTYAGQIYDQDKAYQVALGNLHPITFEQLDNWDPKEAELSNKNIWGTGPYERSPSRNQQKDSFKEYFSNYKFETIQETDFDDTTMKTEEENKTNTRREMEFNSQFSSNRPLNPPMDTNYDGGASFQVSRSYQPSESIGKYPVSTLHRVYPSMQSSIYETRMPGFTPLTRMPGLAPQTKMPSALPQTVMPGFVPQTGMPRPALFSVTRMPSSAPQTVFGQPTSLSRDIQGAIMPCQVKIMAIPETGSATETSLSGGDTEGAEPLEEGDEDDYVTQFSAMDFVETVYDNTISDQAKNESAAKVSGFL